MDLKWSRIGLRFTLNVSKPDQNGSKTDQNRSKVDQNESKTDQNR